MNAAGATVGGEDDEGCCRTKWDAGTHRSLTPPPHRPYVDRRKMDLGLWMMHGLKQRPGHTSRYDLSHHHHQCVQKATIKSTLTTLNNYSYHLNKIK